MSIKGTFDAFDGVPCSWSTAASYCTRVRAILFLFTTLKGEEGPMAGDPSRSASKIMSISEAFGDRCNIDAYRRRRLVVKNLLNPFQDRRCKFGDDIESLEVVDDLLRLGGTKDDSTSLGLPCYPGKSELSGGAAEV